MVSSAFVGPGSKRSKKSATKKRAPSSREPSGRKKAAHHYRSEVQTLAGRRAAGRPRALDWDPPLTVVRVARALGVSKNTIRNMVQRGDIHPSKGLFPLQFSRDEVLRVASMAKVDAQRIPDDGEIASAAFVAFRAGKDVRDVVIEQKITPDQAERLLHQYVGMGGDRVLPGEVIAELQARGVMAGRPFDPYLLPDMMGESTKRRRSPC